MILVLNQFPENDQAPTSRYLRDLTQLLRSSDNPIQWISGKGEYHQIPGTFWGRALRDLSTHLRILGKGICSKSPQVIIASSSPPGLLVVATLLKYWHQASLVHWAMDLHPDLSFALGESPLFRSLFQRLMAWCYPYCDLLLTLDEEMQAYLHRQYHVKAEITPLWPQHEPSLSALKTPASPPQWLYSGNLGKAHEWKTLIDVQLLLEKRNSPFTLRLQGNAKKRLPTLVHLAQKITFEDYAPDHQLVPVLLSSHVLVATQNPLTKGLLWPSKLALLTRLPRPLLWIGPKDSAISRGLGSRPHTGIFEPGEIEKIASWIQDYSILPPESDFQNWIQQQPTKEVSLEQVRKALLPLFQSTP